MPDLYEDEEDENSEDVAAEEAALQHGFAMRHAAAVQPVFGAHDVQAERRGELPVPNTAPHPEPSLRHQTGT